MEHRFEIYYSETINDLNALLLKFNRAEVPLNRASIVVDEFSENILSININPFIQNYLGLHISYIFINHEIDFNYLQSSEIEGLKYDSKYMQKMFLTFQGFDKPTLTNHHLKLVEDLINIVNAKHQSNNLIIYDNGHFKYQVDARLLVEEKENLIAFISKRNS